MKFGVDVRLVSVLYMVYENSKFPFLFSWDEQEERWAISCIEKFQDHHITRERFAELFCELFKDLKRSIETINKPVIGLDVVYQYSIPPHAPEANLILKLIVKK